MPHAFYSVNEAAREYLENERRYAYITPKTFIESIKLYDSMLRSKIEALKCKSDRLSSGLQKLMDTREKVSALEDDLREKTVVVEEKKAEADEFAHRVGMEKAKVTAETEKANLEAQTCSEIQKRVFEQRASCEEDLAKAIPLVQQAETALNTLNKKDFQEAKSLNKPPPGVEDITTAVMHLLCGVDPNIEVGARLMSKWIRKGFSMFALHKQGGLHTKASVPLEILLWLLSCLPHPDVQVDRQGKLKDKSWKGAQKMMNNPEKFLQTLKDFKQVIDECRVPEQNFKAVEPLLALPHFNREAIQKKSTAAAGLAEWVINIYQFYKVVDSVAPKRKALEEATQQLEDANAKLSVVQKLVAELEEKLAKLVAEYDEAIAEKNAVQAEADKLMRKCFFTSAQLSVMTGDVLLASSFVAYAGVFTKRYRDWLKKDCFEKFLKEKQVPMGTDTNVLLMLTSEAEMAILQKNTVLRAVRCASPSTSLVLFIQVTKMNSNKLIQTMERAISFGFSVLIENLDENIEAVLAPVVGRQTIRRGRAQYVKLGDKEISYNPNFKLYLQTPLSNPHYPPEIQAECTIINFTVTEKGDILEDTELILNLEKTKTITVEVSAKVALAKKTGERLDAISEHYRPVARRGALLFFLLSDLFKIHSFYVYSMEAIINVIHRAMDSLSKPKGPDSESISEDGSSGSQSVEALDISEDEMNVDNEGEEDGAASADNVSRKSSTASADAADHVVEGDAAQLPGSLSKQGSSGDKVVSDKTQEGPTAEGEGAEGSCNSSGPGNGSREQQDGSSAGCAAEGSKAANEGEDRGGKDAAEKEGPEREYCQGRRESESGSPQASEKAPAASAELPAALTKRRPESAATDTSAVSASRKGPSDSGAADDTQGGGPNSENEARGDVNSNGAEEDEDMVLDGVEKRVATVVDAITKAVFTYCNRGLFQRHKLTFAVFLGLRVLVDSGVIDEQEAQMLIYCRRDPNPSAMAESVKSWQTEAQWACCRTLEQSSVFKNNSLSLLQNFDQDSLSWKRWYAEEKAETADLPRTFRSLSLFHRILLLRCLRPDRMVAALKEFVVQYLGAYYMDLPLFDMNEVYEESDRNTPIFFVLFPGVDPTPAVESVARSIGCTAQAHRHMSMITVKGHRCLLSSTSVNMRRTKRNFGVHGFVCESPQETGKFMNISMGQGQEKVALKAVERAAQEGGWVMLQNVHLMQDWLKASILCSGVHCFQLQSLQRTLEVVSETAHKDFRCIISSEPPPLPDHKIIPETILQRSIKIADEAPQDLKANLKRALSNFSRVRLLRPQ
ncbi:UNVERIFIED_CONTAM: hypothetical protein H355_008665 [Colinus virginianus]|nr:hypothetical protein H355_008665 [Colinus virginianus]